MLKLLAACAALIAGAAAAQSPPAEAAKGGEARKAAAVEDQIRQRVEARLKAKVDSVTRMPFGLYEVVLGTEVLYVDAAVNYFIAGRVFDARTREDLTQKKRDELLRVDFAALPLEQAVKIVRGNGSRTLVTFEDPNCGYCKKLYRDLRNMKDVTVYTFLYPILSQDSYEKAKNIWCAKDRAAAWDEYMGDGKAPPAAAPDCKHPLQQLLALGQKLDVNGTPTIVFPDGSRVPGAVPLEKIEERLSAAKR
ncbi:MAG TPA: DsbC family protein [Burkholderiaceae bacterium]|jgi:thiol:disulfide interchange protein DsbC|nr:DsbC family protein [Burkholderiaceae bacterium]